VDRLPPDRRSSDQPGADPDGAGKDDPRPPGTSDPGRPRNVFGFFVCVACVAVLVYLAGQKALGESSRRLTPNEFFAQVEKKNVAKARLEGNRVEGEVKEGDDFRYFDCVLPANLLVFGRRTVPAADGKTEELSLFEFLGRNIDEFKYTQNDNLLYNVLVQIAPWFLLFAFIYFLFFRRINTAGPGGGVLSFGRSRAKLVNEEKVKVTFADVAGIDEARDEVQEIIQFLRNPQKFQRIGARIPRGVLLVGPPGTGKTLLAKAIAGEAGVPFFSICGSDFVEMFVGVGASRVRDLFRQAKERSPSIIFLDEIDAVGRRRGTGLGGGHDEREQTLNAILVEMDGFHTDQGVIVIASTNRPDVLDPALSRPGRFDREITIDLADARGREAILRVHARKVKLEPGVELERLARSTPGYSGADLEAVINEAALRAVMHGRETVTQEDLEESRDKVRYGREKKSMVLSPDDRWTTAVHEAGHALATILLPDTHPLHKVTIIPRGQSLGSTMMLPERDHYSMPRKRLLAMIKVDYAGRIAEQLLCTDIDGGAQQDIEHATKLARTMVCRWGMSERLGPINYAPNDETVFLGREVTRTQTMSEHTAQVVDEEIARIVSECYAEIQAILASKKAELEHVAKALLRWEVLSADEVRRLVAGTAIDALRPEPAPLPSVPAKAAAKVEAEAAARTAEQARGPTDRDLETHGGMAF